MYPKTLILLAALANAHAGSISVNTLPATGTDAASGISTSNNYLCALDFGDTTSAIAVNGVAFQQLSLSGKGTGVDNKHPLFSGTDATHGGTWTLAANFSDNAAGLAGTSNSGVNSQADGSMRSLLGDFTFLSGPGVAVNDTATLNFGSLLPGTSYSLRCYYRQWDTGGAFPRRPIEFVFNGEGTNESFAENPVDLDAGGARFIQYNFTAASPSVSMQMVVRTTSNGPHIYAATLQQTSPSNPQAPVINTQPEGFTANFGTSRFLSVSASGSPALSYQWFKNTIAISGATHAVLNFNYLKPSDNGNYHVTATNTEDSTTSNAVSVQVVETPIAPIDAALLSATATADALMTSADANRATTNWTAHWIGPATSSINQWLCYRKTFSLAAKPSTAIARIAADSKYWLWINGQIAVREGGLKRGPNTTDTWYDEIDLAPLLHSGQNTIAIQHWYFGKQGFSHNGSSTAGMIFEMNAEGTLIQSDTTWRMITHPAFSLATVVAQPNYRLPESSLRYDAQLDPGAWTNAAFDDNTWGTPTDRGVVGGAPLGKLWRRPLPLWKNSPLLDFANTTQSGTNWACRVPVNIRFTQWLDVDAPAGLIITVRTDASEGPPLSHEYVTRVGRQSFEFPAWLNGQEARLNIPAGVTVHGLKYRPHESDTQVLGRFGCNDASLMTLWNKAVNTLGVNMMDTWSDCPDRERANWIGDAVVDLSQTPYVFDSRAELTTRKSILDVIRWQRGDHTMYAPVPSSNWGGELPPQILATMGKYGILRYFQNTGDTEFLQQAYPAMRSYLLNVWQMDAQGLVIHRSGGWDWSDWGGNIDVPLLDNTWYLLACEATAQIAPLAGGTEADVSALTSRAQGIRSRFNTAFWNGTAYRSSGYSGATDDRGNAMAVLAGLADASKTAALRTVLTTQQNASPYMEKYVLEALFALGFPDDALNRMRSRYSEMISSSSTTLWELFPTGGTSNHAWSGGPLTLLAENVIGVTPTSPGFANFDVKPSLGTTLTHADLDVPSRHGLIRIGISRNGANHRVSARVPNAITGRLIQPAGGALAGAILSVAGGTSATLDETVSPAEMNITDGSAELVSSVTSSAQISKTGNGTLDIGASSLTAAGFQVTQGTVAIGPGGSLTVSGSMTNNGTLRLAGDAQLNVSDAFTNTGLLDIVTWNGTLPAGFVNSGVVLDHSSVKLESFSMTAQEFSLTIKGYEGHSYQLQRSDKLNTSDWTDIGTAQAGHGANLIFKHTNPVNSLRGFYRIKVAP
ncbi:MAG: hypothetical protein H7Y36_04195 [Armatimonadetes bacterium]|nr:hypothetical protein [Akkermansiaceae bacterium]